MGVSANTISPAELVSVIGTPRCPLIFDVRRAETFAACDRVIASARWRDHRAASAWRRSLPAGAEVVVYCSQGHQVSRAAAALLGAEGARVRVLEGGLEGYVAAGGPTVRRLPGLDLAGDAPSRWVTRERPKIDRVACPWLLRRFVDRDARIFYVAAEWVKDTAIELDATPFDIEGVEYSHRGDMCSFDTMLDAFAIDHAPLRHLARIVRGADTARLDLEPQAAGLLAISLGLSAMHADDLDMLESALAVYDALYAWCRFAVAETHNWPAAQAAR